MAFLFHALVLGTLLLCRAGLFRIDLLNTPFCLPLLNRLIDEVRKPGKGASSWIMVDEPSDCIVDLFDRETFQKQVKALLKTFLPLDFGWSLPKARVEFVDEFSC
jgi:hypothetical protein